MKMSTIQFKAEAEAKQVLFLSSDEPIKEGDYLNWLNDRVDAQSSSWTTIDPGSPLIGSTRHDMAKQNPVVRLVSP